MLGNRKRPWFTFSYQDRSVTTQLEIVMPPHEHSYIFIDDMDTFLKKIGGDGWVPIEKLDGLMVQCSWTYTSEMFWVRFVFKQQDAFNLEVFEIVPI